MPARVPKVPAGVLIPRRGGSVDARRGVRLVVKSFLEKKLINDRFAQAHIVILKGTKAWKHSGFSVDNSIRIYGYDDKTREALSQVYCQTACVVGKDSL